MKAQIAAEGKQVSIRNNNRKTQVFVWSVIGIPFAVYVIFWLFPNLLSVWYTFQNWNGLTKMKFIGLYNYSKMITDPFLYRAFFHNILLMVSVPILVTIISLFLAHILVNKSFKENGIYKVLFFFPNILSTVVIALLWSFIYDGNFGLLNSMLRVVGIDPGTFYWLGDTKTALLAVIPAYVWSNVGFYVVIFMNAMSSIPKSYYEYAIMEGASDFKILTSITYHFIKGIVRVAVLFLFLNTFKGFDTILILTGGGPDGATDVLGLYMFGFAFNAGGLSSSNIHNYGYASTIGMFMFIVLVGLRFVIDKFFKGEQIEY